MSKRLFENLESLRAGRELESRSPLRYKQRVRQSPAMVQGLRLAQVLRGHGGCVNCMEWHPSGETLLSSGDDLNLKIWDASSWEERATYRTGHSRNVFCVKYVPHQSNSFVTAAADGDVRLIDLVHEQGRELRPRVELLSATVGDMSLKIAFLPLAPMSFLTTHQDGTIRLTDLRNARRTGTAGDAPEQVVVQQPQNMFYSISFDPTNQNMFAASSGNHFVRLYDLRMSDRPYDAGPTNGGCVKMWSDPVLLEEGRRLRPNELMRESRRHVTDIQFSSDGNLLANYSDHDVVLFAKDDADMVDGILATKVLQRYEGRGNVETFLKEVRFMADETHVCTGSDSGEVFIWEAATGKLVHRVPGDTLIVNGVEPHPWLPTLAVCGIDSSVKIFEHQGGTGIVDVDPIKANLQAPAFMPFHARTRVQPLPVVREETFIRLEGANELRREGNNLFRQKKIGEALERYSRALAHLNYCPPGMEDRADRDAIRLLIYLNLSAAHLVDRDYRRAEKFARKALELDAKNMKGMYRLAKALIGNGEPENAIHVLQEALDILDAQEEDDEETRKSITALMEKYRGKGQG